METGHWVSFCIEYRQADGKIYHFIIQNSNLKSALSEFTTYYKPQLKKQGCTDIALYQTTKSIALIQ